MQIEEFSLYNDKIENLILDWFNELPLYHVIENIIFVHAGIDEEAGDLWEWGTNDYYFTEKYPADIGKIDGLNKTIIAGHVGTGDIAQDEFFNEIYFDGYNHYYIDGSVYKFHNIPILMIDTEKNKYFQKRKDTCIEILPYDDI